MAPPLSKPVGVAILGSGIFVKEEHLPAVLSCPLLELKAVFSRSLASASAAARLVPADAAPAPDLYAADAGPGRSLDDLLRRADVAAVIVALPIVDQPDFVRAALAAGKHVLAEKPIAKDVATAQALIASARAAAAAAAASSHKGESAASSSPPAASSLLSIAENFRFLPRLAYARDEARKLGRVTHFSVKVMMLMRPSTKWCQTPWRRRPQHQGGFLLDAGVHHAAAARFFLAGPQNRAATVRAVTDSVCDALPPFDSVTAIVRTASGATGTFQHSVGTHMEALEWDVACERGSVTSAFDTVTVRRRRGLGDDGDDDDGAAGPEPVVRHFPRARGVEEEVAAWAEALVSGVPNPLQAPEEALADLEFVEKMFRSGEQGGALVRYELQP